MRAGEWVAENSTELNAKVKIGRPKWLVNTHWSWMNSGKQVCNKWWQPTFCGESSRVGGRGVALTCVLPLPDWRIAYGGFRPGTETLTRRRGSSAIGGIHPEFKMEDLNEATVLCTRSLVREAFAWWILPSQVCKREADRRSPTA